MAQPYMSSRSPPPLQHPKPTHPANPPPEPPKTPGGSTNSSPYSQAQRISSDGGYQRYSSPPVDAPQQHQQQQGFSAYAPQGNGQQAQAPAQAQGYQAQGYGNMAGQRQGGGGDFGWQMNDATTQMGVQFGKSAVAAGQDYVEKNVSRPTVSPSTSAPVYLCICFALFVSLFTLSEADARILGSILQKSSSFCFGHRGSRATVHSCDPLRSARGIILDRST